MMTQKLKEKKNLQLVVIYLAVLMVYHLLFRDYGGDTFNFYSRQMGGHPTLHRILEIMKESWYGLSSDNTSRIIVEIPLFILANGMHIVLWSICNIILHIALMISLMRLTDFKHNTLLLCLLLMYPVYDMHGAGWITAYISYFWPLALAAVSAVALKKMYDGEKIGITEGIFYVLCEIYATNLEICCALFLGILLLFIAAAVHDRRLSGRQWCYTAVLSAVCLANLILILICPGNYVRTGSDIRYWFPDYTSLTVADKITIGVNTVMSELINHNVLWACLCVLIMIFVAMKTKDDIRMTVLSAVPVAAVLLRTVFDRFCRVYMPDYAALFDEYAGAARVDPTNYNSFNSYLPFVFHMLILTIVIVCLINLKNSEIISIDTAYLLCLGLATRMVLAFSPSVYASGRRTMIVIDYMLIYLCVRIYSERCAELPDSRTFRVFSRSAVYVMSAFIVISNIVSICADYFYL